MIPGLVLLVLLAATVVPVWVRLRRRLGRRVTRGHWAAALAVFAAAVLALWAAVKL